MPLSQSVTSIANNYIILMPHTNDLGFFSFHFRSVSLSVCLSVAKHKYRLIFTSYSMYTSHAYSLSLALSDDPRLTL